MNRQKIYNQIIERAQERVLSSEVYREVYHIVPKCMGGSNEKENLVKLTAREHFINHWLLKGFGAKVSKSNNKLKSKGTYTTPVGNFSSALKVRRFNKCSLTAIYNRYRSASFVDYQLILK